MWHLSCFSCEYINKFNIVGNITWYLIIQRNWYWKRNKNLQSNSFKMYMIFLLLILCILLVSEEEGILFACPYVHVVVNWSLEIEFIWSRNQQNSTVYQTFFQKTINWFPKNSWEEKNLLVIMIWVLLLILIL